MPQEQIDDHERRITALEAHTGIDTGEPEPEPDPDPDPAPEPEPETAPVTHQAEAGAPWRYTGTWISTASDRYTREPGATARLSWTGLGVTLHGVRDTHHGIATVTIDGGEAMDVDQYAPSRQEDATVYAAALPFGDHEVTITMTDRTNPARVTDKGPAAWSLDRAVVQAVAGDSAAPEPEPEPEPPPATSARITVSGDRIMLGGQPWWFLGYNSFVWSRNCGSSAEIGRASDIEAWLSSMRHDGHGVVRAWFFRGWSYARLDELLAAARRHNVYVMLTLDDGIAGCGASRKDAGWFSNSSARAAFREHMVQVLQHVRGHEHVFCLEYFNEPGGSGTWQQLRQFYDEMGAVARQTDPDRLMCSGVVAPYWLGGESNFRHVAESPGVDISSLHEYDQNEIISNHYERTRANSAGKPVIVGEFGINANSSGSGCSSFASRADRFRRKVDAYIRARGCAGAVAWGWIGRPATSCVFENLDADTASQTALREATR